MQVNRLSVDGLYITHKERNPGDREETRRSEVKKRGKKLLTVGMALSTFVIAGVVFAAWIVPGTGSGFSKAKSAQALTTNNVGATTTSQLFPGGDGDVKVEVSNPNPFPVTVTKVEANGAVSSSDSGCTDVGGDVLKKTGVSFTTQNLTSGNVVPANGTLTLTLNNAVSMTNQSVNACQGAVFTIPVTFTAGS